MSCNRPPLVKEWMTGDPVAIDPGASARACLATMIGRGIRHLPVIDAERRVVGIVSREDLRAACVRDARTDANPPLPAEPRDVPVAELMTRALELAHADAALEEAAQRMADRGIGCLPVVDAAGRLEGMLSESDVMNALSTVLWTDSVRERRIRERERVEPSVGLPPPRARLVR